MTIIGNRERENSIRLGGGEGKDLEHAAPVPYSNHLELRPSEVNSRCQQRAKSYELSVMSGTQSYLGTLPALPVYIYLR